MQPDVAYLTPSEAATQAGVDRRTIYRWVKDGRIAARRTPGGRHLRILASSLVAGSSDTVVVDLRPPRDVPDSYRIPEAGVGEG